MLTKTIVYFGQKAIIGCDGNCDKAWGINSRPKIKIGSSIFMKSDNELGVAPADPGTYEGGHAKPVNQDELLNRWCCRECERCKINMPGTAPIEENLNLSDFSSRVKM